MSAQRERTAWLLFVGIIAVTAIFIPAGISPTARDLEFTATLMELRQQVDERYVRQVSDEEMRQAAIAGMLQSLDEHSVYIPASAAEEFNLELRGNFHGVGILVDREDREGGLLIIRPIEESPAMVAGVQAGDRIVAVDGTDVLPMSQDEIIERIKGEVGTPVTLTIERGVEAQRRRLDLTMPRAEVASPVLEGYRRNEQGVPIFWVDADAPVKLGYIRLTRFTAGSALKTVQQIEALRDQGMRGLILDLRSNPGGLLEEAVALADAFLESGVIVSKRGEHSPEEVAYARPGGTLAPFPMVVLVNELSASASEVLAGALADHRRAVVVGSRTFGKGSVQDVITLSDSGELKLTTAHYYLPSGRLVHRQRPPPERLAYIEQPGGVRVVGEPRDSEDWGVEPDVEIKIDYRNPQELGDIRLEPPFPRQVRAAVEALLGLIVAQNEGSRASTRSLQD